MRLALAFCFAVLASSCSPIAAKCGPSSCTGCCDAAGACVTGSSNLSCGASGSTCASCPLGQNCVLGQCSIGSTQGGGSGGGSGGGVTGGGSGGGVTGGGTGGGGTGGGSGGGVTGGGSGGGGVAGGGGGTPLIPNVMLLVDTSGSMLLPIDVQNAACPTGCGTTANPCPGTCPTRMGELRASLGTWLAARGTTLRLGLTTYPSGTVCEPALAETVALPAPTVNDVGTTQALQNNASQISVQLQSKTPVGGTPTGASLTMLAALPGLTANDGRADYVVLLTDGLPNCNANNANALCACGAGCTPAQTMACQCTTSICSGTLCSNGCLDSSASVTAVSTLAAAGVKTIVVGFGADTASGAAATVLDAMARVGEAPRSCPNGTSAECGGETCLSNLTCTSAHYRAPTGAALQAVLDGLF